MKTFRIILSYIIFIASLLLLVYLINLNIAVLNKKLATNFETYQIVMLWSEFVFMVFLIIDMCVSITWSAVMIFPFPSLTYIKDEYTKIVSLKGNEKKLYCAEMVYKSIDKFETKVCSLKLMEIISRIKLWSVVMVTRLVFFLETSND